MRPRKTTRMHQTELQTNEALETLLPRLLNQLGIAKTATQLTISRTTLEAWMGKLGISMAEVALRPGESITVIEVEPKPTHPIARVGAWLRGRRS